VRFAVCLQPIKFDPADDELLVRIAQEAGPCEFWLASPVKNRWAGEFLHHRLTRAFQTAGLDPGAHLRVAPWLPRDRFLGFLDEMDVYLDSPSFSGYTTAWQAVHRGMPVVTLEGRLLRQRLAAGLLRQIGMNEGIVPSREAYVATRADGNLAAVRSVERTLIDAVEAETRGSRVPP
jgi:predicted O-linked N-acetylglucosamine transferase (SPINDLY family)